MDKIFMDAKDKNVAKIVIYASESGNFFYDKEKTQEVPAEDMADLFLKGVVVGADAGYEAPIGYSTTSGFVFGSAAGE